MATIEKKKRRPPIIAAYDRTQFELTLSKHSKNLTTILDLHKRGAISNEDYCFLYEDVIAIARAVAYGWWNNAALRRNPKSKWATEQRAKMVQKYIDEAFTTSSHGIPDPINQALETTKKPPK